MATITTASTGCLPSYELDLKIQPLMLSSSNRDTQYHPHSQRTDAMMLRRIRRFLMPSFLQDGISIDNGHMKAMEQEHARSTDFLDGLRGCAALSVMVLHYSARPFPGVAYGYGYDDNSSLWQLPFIRFIYSGATMVAIFFIISGYVLSAKSIKLIRSQSHTSLLKTLSSTTFRRGVRLFLPTFVASFLCYLVQRSGFLGRPYKGYVSTFANDTAAYLEFLRGLFNIWSWEPYHGFYSLQMWTIPVEFRCSMVVFLTLLGLSRCRMSVRLLVEIGGALNCLAYNRWDMAPFFIGMVLAELKIKFEDQQQERDFLSQKNISHRKQSPVITFLLMLLLVCGIYVGCVPEKHPWSTPGYIWLSSLDSHDPKETFRYLSCYGATMIVSAILLLPSCQKIFNTPIARYTGKISYALYLNHGIINRSFGVRFQHRVWSVMGTNSWIQYTAGFVVGFVIYAAVSIWVADLFWRAVDIPSINLARWLEEKCLAKTTTRESYEKK